MYIFYIVICHVSTGSPVEEWNLPVFPVNYQFPPLPPKNSSSTATSLAYNKKIPRILWVAVRSEEDALPANQPRHMRDLFDRNKNWDVRMTSNEEKDKFINSTFEGTSLLWAYHMINPVCGAAKADIWRYAALWAYGGVYIDDDSDMISPLDDILKEADHLIVAFEKNGFNGNRCFVPRHHLSDFSTFERISNPSSIPDAARKDFQYVILNWAIMSAPGHLMIEHTIKNVVEIIRNEFLREEVLRNLNAEYGWAQIMCSTGPSLLTGSLREYVFDAYRQQALSVPPENPIADLPAIQRVYGSVAAMYKMAWQDFKEFGGKFKAAGVRAVRHNTGHYMNAMRNNKGHRGVDGRWMASIKLLKDYVPAIDKIRDTTLSAWQGQAVQGQNGRQIFFIDQGKRRGIPNYDTFMALNFSMGVVHIVSDVLLSSIPIGAEMPYLDYTG